MPPTQVKKDDGAKAIQKDVEFVSKDADEQVASGIVMVPDKVDLQNDFVREEQIREFAEQFADFESVGQAGGGIMHAVFPDEWMHLERNEVLDEATEIGGVEAPAGAWIQDWSIDHEELWGLVDDGILAGYSIGLDAVRWGGPYEQDAEDVDDVEVPSEIDEDELIWQIVEGITREVSTVDIPAVPDAEILEAKSADAVQKRLADHLGNRDAFIEQAQERGHDEEAAERMWDVLNEAAEIEGAGQPGKESVLARLGKTLVEAATLGAVGGDGAAAVESAKARAAAAEEDPEADAQADKDVPGDDTPDDGGADDVDAAADDPNETTDMSDNPDGEEKELAEKNAEQISELTAAVEDLTETIAGPEPKTAEIEIGGETYEVREEAAKEALGVDEETSVGDAIKQLNEEVERTKSRIDQINRQSGGSGQVDPAAAKADEEENDEGGLEGLGKALS